MVRVRAFPVAVVIALSVLMIGSTSASGFTPTGSDVHLWAADWNKSVVDTSSEAVTVATRNDLVVGQSKVYKPWLSAMYAAHPGVVVAAYKSSISAGGENYTYVANNHPSWFLRDRNGHLLHDSYGAYLIDPGSDGVRTWTISLAKQAQTDGYNAFFLDSLGTYGLEAFGGTPVDPATGKLFTPTTWMAATRGLALAVNNAISAPLVGNGLRDGSSYFASTAGTSSLLDAVDAAEFEACFRGATFSPTWYPSESLWLQQVRALEDVQSRGKTALCWTKLYSSATAAQQQHWHDFALSSFLLAQQGHEYFYYQGSKSNTALTSWGETSISLGSPSAARQVSGSLYSRQFTNGMVVVNPSGSSASMSLPRSYMLSGKSVNSLTVSAHSGVILTSP
jgi:Hypothetical glycosyl hydrolase family 15